MKMKIYSVYDCKVGAYMQPFYMQSKGHAVRVFGDTARDDKSAISKHPEDYTLFELGEFDDSNASFVMHASPVSVGVAIEFLKS